MSLPLNLRECRSSNRRYVATTSSWKRDSRCSPSYCTSSITKISETIWTSSLLLTKRVTTHFTRDLWAPSSIKSSSSIAIFKETASKTLLKWEIYNNTPIVTARKAASSISSISKTFLTLILALNLELQGAKEAGQQTGGWFSQLTSMVGFKEDRISRETFPLSLIITDLTPSISCLLDTMKLCLLEQVISLLRRQMFLT